MLIINGTIYLETHIIENGYIWIQDERIKRIGPMDQCDIEDVEVVDALHHFVIPGFIDQHIHGAYGADHMDATMKENQTIAQGIPREGTTSYLATTMTQSKDAIVPALKTIVDYKLNQNKAGEAEILGIHLEGPFISKKHLGAQNPLYVQKPTVSNFNEFWDVAEKTIKLITFAPEEAESGFLEHITSLGVVASAGHTDADYTNLMDFAKRGLTNLTHFHNAMLPHHHRKPGAVTAGLINPTLKAEIIADGIHVHKDAVYATYKIKGAQGIIGITDSMRAKGLPDGKYDLGGQEVIKLGRECRIETGSLAGSVAEMDFVAQNLKSFTGCTMEELILMTSTNSARQLGVFGRKGSIAIGKDADIVIVDANITVQKTICRGRLAYSAK